MDIYELIKNGEGKTIEFKEVFPTGDQIAKTITAFANMAGGKIIIGIKDSGDILGIKDEMIADYKDRISNIIYDSISPVIVPDIYSYNINNKNILIVEVFPSQLKPHYLKKKGQIEGTYIRLGATNKKADIAFIKELERQKLNSSFDEEVNYEYEIDDSKISGFSKVLGKYLNKNIQEKDLINLKLLKKVGVITYPTNAFFILNGEYSNVGIKCARFKGDTVTIFLDRKELEGNIFEQMDEALKFIKFNIKLRSEIKDGLQRHR